MLCLVAQKLMARNSEYKEEKDKFFIFNYLYMEYFIMQEKMCTFHFDFSYKK